MTRHPLIDRASRSGATLPLLAAMLIGVLAPAAAAQTGTLEYDSGWLWHSAEITGGPANSRFQLQSRRPGGSFQNMEWRGPTRTDDDGNWSGWNVNQGIGPLPGHKEVRACWLDNQGQETGQYTQITAPTMARENTSMDNAALIPLALGQGGAVGVDFTLYQNERGCVDPQRPLGWLAEGSMVPLVLAEPFIWLEAQVQSTNPGAMQIAQSFIDENDPHVLLVQIGQNTRNDPFVGIRLQAQVQYDGSGQPGAARPSIFMVGEFDVDGQGLQQVEGRAVLFELDRCDRADVNGDGSIDFDDLLEVLAKWGPCR